MTPTNKIVKKFTTIFFVINLLVQDDFSTYLAGVIRSFCMKFAGPNQVFIFYMKMILAPFEALSVGSIAICIYEYYDQYHLSYL